MTNANLEVFALEDTVGKLPPKIAALSEALERFMHPGRVKEVRQKGMMAAAILKHDRPPGDRVGHQVAMAARQHGVIVRPLGDAA